MKKQLLIAATLCFAATVSGQTTKDYEAVIKKFEGYYNNNLPDSVYSLMSERTRSLMPKDKVAAKFKMLYTQIGKMNSYSFTKEDATYRSYKAEFEKATFTMLLSLSADNKLDIFRFVPYKPETTLAPGQSELVAKTTSGDIYGILSVPDTKQKMPVVLIIAGSGPTDMDGNSVLGVKGDIYRRISDSLVKQGIACARYDKRGVGRSVAALRDQLKLSFEDMVADARAFVQQLRADSRFSKVVLLGHSEGSLIGMTMASEEKVDGFISLAGAGQRGDKILEQQFAAQSVPLSKKAVVIMDSIRAGYTVTDVPDAFASIFNASLQPYIGSWFRHDPEIEIKKLTIPVLILQGTTDLQIKVADAQRLKKAYPKATLKVIDGMNHVLKNAPQDREKNIATYSDASLSLSPELMPEIVKFVKTK